MNEIILSTTTIPEPLFLDKGKFDYIGELYGSCVGSELTVDKFLEWTHENMESE